MPKILIKNKKSLIIVLSTCILIVCLILANYLSLYLIKTDNQSTSLSSTSFELHFITLAKSQVKNEALTLSTDYQSIGAGGFIWENDGYYHVASSAYLNKNDASLVQNSLKTNNDIESEIFTIKFNSFEINGTFNNDESKVINKALNIFLEYYKSIYDIAISLDTAVYNEISARMAVNNAHNNLSTTLDNFELLFKDNDNSTLTLLHNKLKNAKEISQSLCGGILLNDKQTYSSLLKYRYLEVLHVYYGFLNS